MSAVSNKLTPASMHMSTSFLASSTWVSPNALKNDAPPKVAVPKERAETFSPELPKSLYSTVFLLLQNDPYIKYQGPTPLLMQTLDQSSSSVNHSHIDGTLSVD